MTKYLMVLIGLILLGICTRIAIAPSCLFGPDVLGRRTLPSPDEHLLAEATNMHEWYFWGGGRSFYKFAVKDSLHQDLRSLSVDAITGDVVEWRAGEGSILWTSDGSTVVYEFNDVKLTLKLHP